MECELNCLFETTLNIPILMKFPQLQLFYDLLEAAVYDVFPELAESNAAMKFKKFTV